MRKLLLLPITILFLFSFLTSTAQKANKQTGDDPAERDRQAAELMKDPALGYVPYQRLLNAIEHTEQLKEAQRQNLASRNNSSSNLVNAQSTPLSWIERGPIYDSVGPSNGNTRGGSTINYTAGRMRGFLLDTLNDPSGNTAFASGVAGGIWKCTNFLSTECNWTKVNDRFANLAISSICQDPTNPQIIYFATGEPTSNADAVYGGGIWKSTNGGTTFTLLASTTTFLRSFKIGCDAGGNVYLACRTTNTPISQQSGLFRSTNGGTSWTDITPNNLTTNNSCTDFVISASGNLNAAFGYLGSVVNQRYTTTPATVTTSTWSSGAGFRISNAAAVRTKLAVAGNILYAVTINTSYNADSCYKSIDGGVNWTLQNSVAIPTGLGSGQGWYNITLAINPSNPSELISGGLDAYKSTDNGATWTRFTYWVTSAPYVHADHHYAQYWIAGGQTRMIIASDGGLFYSNDNGATFNAKNKNLGLKQFYSAAIHPAAGSNYLLAGAQDNGTHALSNAGLSYSFEVTGGDGCIVHINQQNPLIQYGSYVYNQYRRSTNGGVSWSSVNLSSNTGQFVNPFDYDDAQNIMYCGNTAGTVRRWDNANTSNTSTIITVTNMTGSLLSAKYSPYTANRLFFGTNNGKLFRLDNANTATSTAATDITGASFPNGTIICVNTGTDDNNLVATYSNYGVNNVWVSSNGGTSWTAVDGDLPDMPVRWAMFEPGDNSKLFLATEAGIYTTTNINGASTQWLPETTFPTVSTYMLKMRTSDSTIVAGTHGRGLWTAKIPAGTAANPNVTINQAAAQADPTSASPINFTVVFDQPVINFTTGDVTLTGTAGATTATVTGGPTTYNVAVSGMTSNGTVIATIAAGVCTNAALDPNNASTSTDNTVTYNLPATAPTVTINQAAAQADPTSASPINFTSVFSEPVTGFTAAGVNLSGTAGAVNKVVTGGPTTYNIAVSGMTASGTVIATIPANAATGTINVLGNTASTSTDNTVTFNLPPPPSGCTTVNPVANDTLCNGSTHPVVTFTSPTAGTTFSWTNNNISIGLGASGSGNLPSFTATNVTAAPITATITVTPQVNNFTINGALVAGDLTLTTGRLFRNGVASACGSVKPYPGTSGTGPYFYDVYSYTNSAVTSVCVTATLVTNSAGNVHLVAYNGSFNPANLGTNFIGDIGTSSVGPVGLPQGMGIDVASGATLVLVAMENNIGESCASYSINVSGLVCTGTPTTFGITVNPSGSVNAVPNQAVCQGAPTAPVNFTSTVPGTIFNWTNNNPSIGLAAAGNGNIASFIAQNPTTVPQVATITVTPAFGSGGVPMSQDFTYTGAVQTWVVPAGVTSINIKAWGAQGNSNAASVPGGLGGYAQGTLAVTPGQTLYINAGGGAVTSVTGGFNGGGDAGSSACASAQAGGGGGASDVRVAANTLAARVLVAAGGGGAGGNRVTGCGRGTGGGGGAGYYGGGGGAGWPGIPGSQGPVPTGGTQSAGGSGGVTTFSPGPTNGFAGASGIGGAGGTEVSSSQGGNATAESGGVGGGLVGADGLYNPANNWCGQSGAGGSSYIGGVTAGITTPGIQSGNGHIQISYAAGGLSCAGAPTTFTITVSPNANLIIVADPGTTLCEGDPTLLTVYDAGSATGPGNLYVQTGAFANGSPSQVFEPVNAAFNSQGADDFTIPSGTLWTITNVTTQGIGTGIPTSVNVFFYNNSGSNLPGAPIASYNNVTTFTQAGGNYNVTLPTPLNLGGGTYWVSFQVNMSFATGGQWFWGNFGSANIGNPYAWQNPGGGFGTPCSGWGYGATGCGVGGTAVNNVFTLVGTSVTTGPIATGTFLWSPAAGLSSITSNPVAASPMNTTTYTVTRTTVPGGCIASANITITVNKRPTVTVQPVSQVNCSGTTATFTVGGTGTGLTYQWQQSVTGVGGPWTNLTNIAPYGGATGPVLTINPVSGVMNGYAYRCVLSGTCAAIGTANISNAVLLTVNPLPNVSITPPVSCGGVAGIYGTQLSVNSSAPPIPGNVSASSGAISVVIPDGTGVAAISTLNIAGVPANATITQVKITMNMNHTWVGDVDVNIKSPNAAILNLVGGLDGGTGGNSSDNFTNTAFSSLGGATISGAAAPRTGTYAAEARVGYGPTGYIQAAPATWGGLTPTATSANGVWTLAMGDWAGGDQGTLTSWSISIDYTTPGSGGGPTLTYVWSPLAGLYNNSTATVAYTGTNTPTVYAAPTAQTVYTVTATDVATGCVGTATALVNYTPPAPTITPSSVTMCLGDPAVMLKSSTSTPGSCTTSSGAISVAVPDGSAVGAISTLAVSCVPAGATVTGISVNFSMPAHTYVADMTFNLKAPNGTVLNLDKNLGGTGSQAGTYPNSGFVNATISSSGSAALSSASTTPITGTWKADLINGAITPGYPISDPIGYASTATSWNQLYSTPNGTWTLAMADDGGGDVGTLTSWSITINYIIGVPATPAVWTPAAGLYSNASATTPYVAGTAVDSVWTRPTPSGVYNYQATVQNIITNNSTIATPMAGGNGNNLVAFNVRNNNATPINFNSISSNTFGSGAVVSRVFYKAAPIAGNPGPISAANGWIQFGTANNTVTAGSLNLLMSGLTLSIPAGATYGIALDMTGATFPAYTNGTGTIQTYSNNNVDLITDGNVGWGGPAAPGTPANNPRNFNGSIDLGGSGPGTCTSPARTVVVTVKDPTTVVTQPVNQTICTDKVATFTVAGGGSGPFSYQWQVSTNGGNPPWINVANGGVYSGATSATLTITAPPVSMSGYQYRCVITGAAPCAAATSFSRILTVNPLPVVVISASPYTSLLPGLVTTLSSTVSPNAAASYSWLHDGASVPGANTGSLSVDVDGLGDYQLSVIDVNGCTSSSNIIKIKDSASGKCFIYPNPTNGQFQVRYYSVANNVLPRSLTVYDAKGDRAFTKFYTIGRPYDRMDVDMRAYGKGLYWVEIGDLNGNRITMCRVVIQ